jgi:hypothetical protein
MQTEAAWHSRVDWEWRMKQEVDGSIEKIPALQKWLKRVRGESHGSAWACPKTP